MAKKRFYAVVKGYIPGIYKDWESCKKSVHGFSGPLYQGFPNETAAIEWYRYNGGDMELLLLDKAEELSHEKSIEPDEFDTIPMKQDNDSDWFVQNKDNSLIAELNAKLSMGNSSEITKEFKDFCIRYPQYERLSFSQKIAVQTVEGKSLLFAVPGSGKTTVLIAHAGFLIYGQKSQPVTPNMLMNLTFTVPAAREMAERYNREFHPCADEQPAFMTIHSFCWREIIPALRMRGYSIPVNLVNTDKEENQNAMTMDYEDDTEPDKEEKANCDESMLQGITSYSLLKAVLKRFHLSARDESIREIVSSIITSIKNRQLSSEDYSDKVITIKKREYKVAQIYEAYQEELEKHKCMDFDDMLQYSLRGLQECPDVLKELQSKYSYWSIDETQDNSRLQNMLLSLLVGEVGNLFVVGDDDQSIYSFRGAEPSLLLNYGVNENVKAMILDTNYRSDSLIVEAAKSFIEENRNRADKRMSARINAARGKINFVTNIPSEQNQYQYIVETAMDCVREGKTLAIIYRQNASAFPIMYWLSKHKINFHVAKDYKELAFGSVFRDVINIMTLAIDPGNWEAFNSCRYALEIFIKKDVFEKMAHFAKTGNHVPSVLDWVLENQENLRNRIEFAKSILQNLRNKSPFEAAKYLLENVVYKHHNTSQSAAERLREYAILAACTPYSNITEFLSQHSMLLDYAVNDNELDSCITLTSMHSSKGLEFDHVIIVDALDEIMHRKQEKNYHEFDYEDREEPRRIFYVAITRAKSTLDILIPQKYFNNAERPCKYIVDLMYACEMYADVPVQHLPEQVTASDSPYVLQHPQVYYGVRRGFRTGIFDNWTEAEQSIHGYSCAEYKKFSSFEETAEYVEGYADMGKMLSFPTISSMMSDIHPETFMDSVDIPDALTNAILQWFGVSSLLDLTPNRVQAIKSQPIVYTDNQETNYHGRVDFYILVYMLVNFFKIWAPLQNLLKSRHLNSAVKILELGAGPGTSAIALIYFYQLLARDNPEHDFYIDYNVVEREADFVKAFNSLMDYYIKHSDVPNLKISWSVYTEDIHSFVGKMSDENEYDMIIESNVLNGNEDLQSAKINNFAAELTQKLSEGGALVLIEPGKGRNVIELTAIRDYLRYDDFIYCDVSARKAKVIVKDISLYLDVKKLGLRNAKIDEHWFAYSLFRKGCISQ